MAKRYDFQKLDKIETLPTGFLKFPVYAARTGIQIYRDSEGNIIREYRPPEEVFSQDTMSSLRTTPLTNDHPKEMVSPSNAKDLMVGFTTDSVEKVRDQYLKTHVVVTDKQTIEDIKRGKIEVSMGYNVELDESPGVVDGKRYDMIQRNIVHNHIALVNKGRAGGEVRLRLDGKDAYLVDDNDFDNTIQTSQVENEDANHKRKDRKMPKVKIGDREFDLEKDVADAVSAEMKRLKKMMEGKKDGVSPEELDKAQARIDHLEAELAKSKGKENKMDADAFQAALKQRRTIEKTAERCLNKDEADKMDEMSNAEIMKKVIEAETPGVKLDEKSDAYIEARFDQIADTVNVSEEQTKKAGDTVTNNRKEDAKNAETDGDGKIQEARAKAQKRDSEAWKEPTATMKTK